MPEAIILFHFSDFVHVSDFCDFFLEMYRVNHTQKLSEAERGSIVTLANLNMSNAAIARQLNCSKPTVALWKQRFADTGHVKGKPGSARPRATTQMQDALIIQAVMNQPITTARNIAGIKFLKIK